MKWKITMLLVLVQILLRAQGPPTGISPQSDTGSIGNPLLEELPDTSKILYFYSENPGRAYAWSDTSLSGFLQHYDPARRRDWDYLHLGNLGSPARPLAYEAPFRRGYDLGYHQFDPYYTPATAMPFYLIDKAYSQVSYSQGKDKNNTIFRARFARDFARNVQLTLDYQRINNKGQFQHQATYHTAFTTGLWYRSQNRRYQAFVTFASNVANLQDNGGIASDTVFDNNTGAFAGPVTIPVKLLYANTRHNDKGVAFRHFYRLNRGNDSIPALSGRTYELSHLLQYHDIQYKYSDTRPDSSFYGDFWVYPKGLRTYMRVRQVENTFSIRTASGTPSLGQQRDLLEAGLSHTFFRINQEPGQRDVQNLFVFGRWSFHPARLLRLNTYAHFGFWKPNLGDYRLQGDVELDLGRLGVLEGRFVNQLYAPSLVQNNLNVTSQPVWTNDFNKTWETEISGRLYQPWLRLGAGVRYGLINNYIYFDERGKPAQVNALLSIFQVSITNNLSLGPVHLDSWLVWQNSTSRVIRLPEVSTKHSLYAEAKLFRKVLLTRIGVDVRLNTPYFAPYYQPLTGQFQLQDQKEVPFYPATDLFLSARVNTFRLFVRWEGCSTYFLKGQYYQTYLYPFFTEAFRFGIDWKLSN